MTGSRDDAMPTPPDAEVARTLAFSRSLRRSRRRRAGAERRRRRLLRGRGSALLAAIGLCVASAGALAQQRGGEGGGIGVAADAIVAAQRALGVAADGVVGPQTRRATRRFQRAKGLTVDGVIGPQTLRALGVRASAARAAGAGPALQRIAACESGGDPHAVSAGGRYRGKYQFSRATWAAVGGSGDPAAASEAEQDRRAAALLAQAGPGAWPSCG